MCLFKTNMKNQTQQRPRKAVIVLYCFLIKLLCLIGQTQHIPVMVMLLKGQEHVCSHHSETTCTTFTLLQTTLYAFLKQGKAQHKLTKLWIL